jgi:hypothetical protein
MIGLPDGKMPIELIGPINSSAGNGPSNGMSALQAEFKKIINQGLNWFSIKTTPSDNSIPWYWYFENRLAAISHNGPFIQGPNMLFLYSGKPRIDAYECALLDAANCQAMFCHTEWYRSLISKNRKSTNKSDIILWPYPIDPWPDGPSYYKYDLLIYEKNGNHPQLIEHLAEIFPNHIQIHYGKYRREQLFEAARHSRVCAYLADDDHGPLALQEILLSGCPVVGVRTGAPFILHGITGVVVDRLPPGRQRIQCDNDKIALSSYIDAIDIAHGIDRCLVRTIASDQFNTDKIVDFILTTLYNITMNCKV